MGNIPSTQDRSSSITDRSYALKPHTLSLLETFGVFSKFPTNQIEADQIISNHSANALQHVSSGFCNHLGGHRKRKRDI